MHTVPTSSDAEFEYSFDTLKRYVDVACLDGIAITNHDMFDSRQFRAIREGLDITVFPGIEINVEQGHILLISDDYDLDDFQNKADLVNKKNTCATDRITVNELEEIYGDLNRYLLIPHYDKNPSIGSQTITRLGEHMVAGEVSSHKKFIASYKDINKLTPVLFSDQRMRVDLHKLPTKQTYIDCGDLTLRAIKQCLMNRKVALSEKDGNQIFQIFDDGQKLSTGLNVLLGARSSGKSHTLDSIADLDGNTKYIKQFSLVQKDEKTSKKLFDDDLKTKRSQFAEGYLAGFKRVLDDVMSVNINSNDRKVDRYVTTLLKSAEDANKQDAFSKVKLFNETDFIIPSGDRLRELINATIKLIENIKYRQTVEKHIQLAGLKSLACELIEMLWGQSSEKKRSRYVNNIVKDVKAKLNLRTAAVQLEDVDLYKIALDLKRVERFNEIVNFLKAEYVISEESVQDFTVVAKKQAFSRAGEVKAASGTKSAFSNAYNEYDDPYEYLQRLLQMEELPPAEHYKLFTKIGYEILNRDGNTVSGGQRSEFRLLQEINDAQNYDMLLIDEPESSFDNIFLNSDVNKIIRILSTTMPVVVVTHNSTVGASIGADYILYACRDTDTGTAVYRLYSGHPTDENLESIDGRSINNHSMMMNSLEAGVGSYEARRKSYEAIEG